MHLCNAYIYIYICEIKTYQNCIMSCFIAVVSNKKKTNESTPFLAFEPYEQMSMWSRAVMSRCSYAHAHILICSYDQKGTIEGMAQFYHNLSAIDWMSR